MERKSRSVEVKARSVEEAIAQALRQLGLAREQVQIEVIKQGSRGLLGLLSEDSIVRVTSNPVHSAQPEAEPISEEETVVLPRPRDGETLPRPRDGETVPPVGRPTGRPSRPDGATAGEEVETPPRLSTAHEKADVAQVGSDVLQSLMRGLGLNTRVTAEEVPPSSQSRPDSVYLNIGGEGLGVLIGRRGATLNDLQYLTCLLVSRRVQRWPNLIVDVERYKARREKSLVELAQRMAERVRTTGQPIPLEPMPPNERRIVHLALREDPDVYTESSGEEEERKVVIRPKK